MLFAILVVAVLPLAISGWVWTRIDGPLYELSKLVYAPVFAIGKFFQGSMARTGVVIAALMVLCGIAYGTACTHHSHLHPSCEHF